MADQCPTCGQAVKVVGNETKHFEPADQPGLPEAMAAEQGPRWRSRREAWLDGYRHGEQHARMTGQDRAAAVAEERERRDEVRRELQRRASDAEAEERRRVHHGMNAAGAYSAKRAYQVAIELLAALDTAMKVGATEGEGERLDREVRKAEALVDWRCECATLNRGHEAFCFTCGAGKPESREEADAYVLIAYGCEAEAKKLLRRH